MRDFFKDLWDDKTIFVRFIKLMMAAGAMVLMGFSTVIPAKYQPWAIAAAGVLTGLAAFIPVGDKTPENVKQLANALPQTLTPSTLNAAVIAAKDHTNAEL